MSALLAALPILLVCGALAVRVPAAWAAAGGIVAAGAVAALAFPVDPGRLGGALLGWSPTLISVLVIVAGGLALARLVDVSGAQAVMARAVEARVRGPLAAALLTVHGVVPFAESVTGFGVGVMVGVPLLLHLGLGRSRSALLGLFGLVAVPWGALAPGTLIAARLVGVDLDTLGVATARMNLVPCLVTGVAAALVAVRVTVDGRPRGAATGRAAALGAGSGVLLWAAVLAANTIVGTPLAGVVGSLVVVAVHLVVARLAGGRRRRGEAGERDLAGRTTAAGADSPGAAPGPDGRGSSAERPLRLGRALVPYGVLVAGLLGTAGRGAFVSSPATWLVVTCLVAVPVLRVDGPTLRALSARVGRMWLAVGLPTGAFLVLGVLMAQTGMSEALARAAAGLGPAYLALAPVVGAVGGFVTGSNAGANSMFAAAQAHAAQALHADPVLLVAVTNVAAAMLTMASPSRVEMAAQFVDPPGGEPFDRRGLMARALAVCAVAVAGLAVATFVLA